MDLTNEQWQRIAEYIPKPKAQPGKSGRPPQDCRAVLNGILWASGAKVPAAGAESSVTAEQLAQNHDDKPTPKPRKPRKPKAKPKAK